MPLTADQATRLAPGLLAAVVLCAGLAVVVPLAPTGDGGLKDFEPQVATNTSDQGGDLTTDWPDADWPVLAENLDALNHLKSTAGDQRDPGDADGDEGENPDDPTPTNPGDDPDEIPTGGEFKYVGAIIAGDRVSGLIELGGAQRFVSPGDVIGDYEIIQCRPGHVILEIDGARKKLALEPRSAQSENSAQRYRRNRDRAIERQRDRLRRDVPSPDESTGGARP